MELFVLVVFIMVSTRSKKRMQLMKKLSGCKIDLMRLSPRTLRRVRRNSRRQFVPFVRSAAVTPAANDAVTVEPPIQVPPNTRPAARASQPPQHEDFLAEVLQQSR